jgi:hypothetical protein
METIKSIIWVVVVVVVVVSGNVALHFFACHRPQVDRQVGQYKFKLEETVRIKDSDIIGQITYRHPDWTAKRNRYEVSYKIKILEDGCKVDWVNKIWVYANEIETIESNTGKR